MTDMTIELVVVNNVLVRRSLAADARGSIWFIHAFGESGFSFDNLLNSNLGTLFNLYVPDLPGFGASPLKSGGTSLVDTAQIVIELIQTLSPTDQLFLVAHSVGGIIGTKAAQTLGQQVKAYFNIEGNLTDQDAYFSGQAANYSSAQQFKEAFLEQVYEMAQTDRAFKRYFASLSLAHPEALMGWGMSSVQHSPSSGAEFAALECDKLYYWGKASTPEATQQFIGSAAIPNQQFSDSGHWPMIDQPERCIEDITEFFMSSTNG